MLISVLANISLPSLRAQFSLRGGFWDSIHIQRHVLADCPTTFLGLHRCRHLRHRPRTRLASLSIDSVRAVNTAPAATQSGPPTTSTTTPISAPRSSENTFAQQQPPTGNTQLEHHNSPSVVSQLVHTWPCVVPSEEVISPSPQMMHLTGALCVHENLVKGRAN